MKKLLAIKERPADGGQDAHEKGDRSIMLGFAIFARYTITYKHVPRVPHFNLLCRVLLISY